MNLRITSAAVLVALVLSACGAVATAPASPAPDANAAQSPAPAVAEVSAAAQASTPAAAIEASASAAAAPTPTFEVVVDAEPSAAGQASAAAQPSSAPAAAGGATGNTSWRDQVLRSDALLVAIENLPPPSDGEVYSAWLAGADKSLPLGALAPAATGPTTLTYISPANENLIGSYDRVYVGKGATADATAKLGEVVLAGELPQQSLVHVRHVLFSIGITPAKLGFALGLRQETDELLRHAQFLKEAYDTNDLALEKVHAEHIINIIGGAQAEGFGDLNGDGKAQNPGDGYGLLPNGQQEGYIKGMIDHARLAAESPDATENIKLHAGHVQIAGENTTARIQQVQDAARRVLQAPATAQTQADVLNILALSQQAIQGIDLNNDEQIAPVPGEGGVLTAYQHAQLMAGIDLSAEAAATVAALPTVVAAPAAAQQIAIDIVDNTFSAAKITVPVGAAVVWTHTGQKKHTVTADDGSFDSGELTNGGSFAKTFEKPGTYQYYCTIHGGAGGQGMTATIVVAEAAAAAPPAAQAPAAQASAKPSDHGHSSAAAAPSSPPVASAAAPQAPAPPPAAGKIDVAIGDNTFTQKEISVPLGTTISWSHTGQRPHTVTADDSSYNSDTMQNGGTFEQTFSAPGVYAYYCEFHGGPGGVGMAGVIRVEDR